MSFKVIDLRTGQEAEPSKIALTEEWAHGLVYSDIEGFALGEDDTLYLLDECGSYRSCPTGRFFVVTSVGVGEVYGG